LTGKHPPPRHMGQIEQVNILENTLKHHQPKK